jgi:hypothetical protein
MRLTRLVVPALLPLLALVGCSSSSSGVTTTPDAPAGDTGSSGSDSSIDSASDPDTGSSTDTGSGSDTGSGTDTGSSADSGPCSSPAGCPASNVCCGTIPITGGTPPACTTGTISIVCAPASSCATSLGSTCTGTQKVRLCTKNADCTESTDNLCCTFGGGSAGGTLSFCANTLIAVFGSGKCM